MLCSDPSDPCWGKTSVDFEKISLEVLKIPFWRIFTLNEQRTWGKYQHIDVDCDWGIKSVRSIFSESI